MGAGCSSTANQDVKLNEESHEKPNVSSTSKNGTRRLSTLEYTGSSSIPPDKSVQSVSPESNEKTSDTSAQSSSNQPEESLAEKSDEDKSKLEIAKSTASSETDRGQYEFSASYTLYIPPSSFRGTFGRTVSAPASQFTRASSAEDDAVISLRARVMNTSFQRRKMRVQAIQVQAAMKIQALARGREARKLLKTTDTSVARRVLLAREEAALVRTR